MAFLDYEQKKFLITFIEKYLEQNPGSKEALKIKELNLISSLNKNAWEELIREDIEMVAENEGVELTKEEMVIAMQKMYKYDHSDYNEYISYVISNVKDDE